MGELVEHTEDAGPADAPGLPLGPAVVRLGARLDPLMSTLTAPLRGGIRNAEKTLAHIPTTRLVTALPRTTGFAVRSIQRRNRSRPDGLPSTRLTPSLLGWVALDEALMSLTISPDRLPHRADYLRLRRELADARDLYAERGWLADPRSYHRTPPPLDPAEVRISKGWAHGLRYERLHFASGYEPVPGESGRDRWLSYDDNKTAGAWVLRHRGNRPRPWVVCIHGFGMGQAAVDFPAFRVQHLFHDLGLNVIGPTQPLHGPRKSGRLSGDGFLGFDLMNPVHGLTQSVWDVRRILGWVRAQAPRPTAVGVFGVSLGAYVSTLVAALEPDLRAVIAGIPVVDLPGLFNVILPPAIVERAEEHEIFGGAAEAVHRVVSPLAMPVATPAQNRFIFAGLADRMSRPAQAHALWRHWDEPAIRWYPGNHVGYLWSTKVQGFIDEVLVQQGLTVPRS